MIKISTLLLFAFLLFLSTYALSQTNEEAGKKVDSLFASYNSQTPGAAVAIVKDGKIIFKKGYGMADLEHTYPSRHKQFLTLLPYQNNSQHLPFIFWKTTASSRLRTMSENIYPHYPIMAQL